MKVTEVAAAVIYRADGAFLLGQRGPGTFYPGYWEFPGGKVEPGETPLEALKRELREELTIEVLAASPWIVRVHHYEHAYVRLHFFRVDAWQGPMQALVHSALTWQQPGAATITPMLPANGPVLSALALPDFYAISHAHHLGIAEQLQALEVALSRGLRLLQIREAPLAPAQRADFASQALALCRAHGARLLINGDEPLARAIGADGVHLTSQALQQAGQRPDFALVGASCHNAADLARAEALQLDFAVLGPVRPTASHPGQPGIGWATAAELIAGHSLPIFALGGLGMADLPAARAAGAHGVAAIRAAWRA